MGSKGMGWDGVEGGWCGWGSSLKWVFWLSVVLCCVVLSCVVLLRTRGWGKRFCCVDVYEEMLDILQNKMNNNK